MSFQDEDEQCTVRILKYLIAENNLYVVMEHCQQSMKGLLRSQRIVQSSGSTSTYSSATNPVQGPFAGAYVSDAYTRSMMMEPWEAAEHMRIV